MDVSFRVHLLATGSELSSADRRDSNGPWMAERLTELGARVVGMSIVPDDKEILQDTLRGLLENPKLSAIIMTGGLGPTEDDLTIDVLAELTGLGIKNDSDSLKKIDKLIAKRGLDHLRETIRRQARALDGACILKNHCGLAPGLYIEAGKLSANGPTFFPVIAALPGVPAEMRRMFQEELLPLLRDAGLGRNPVFRKRYFLYGLSEVELEERFFSHRHSDLPAGLEGWGVSSSDGYLKLFIETRDAAASENLEKLLEAEFAGQIFSRPIASVLHELCLQKGLSVALAESCTGGLLGKTLTELPGASACFLGGIVSYSNEAKMRHLGVQRTTLQEHGAVSRECALEMALGACHAFDADFALSVTGIAGPGGGSPEKPVGTVFLGLACRSGQTQVIEEHFAPDRERIRRSSTNQGLYHLYRFLLDKG